ncbi:MAG TPA: DUF547 domain-containing protein [Rectinemataceae bacterium]|nr:DUF547 domain-containing protein [Rectinemataceae bacterium]
MSEDLVELSAAFSRSMLKLRESFFSSSGEIARAETMARLAAAPFRGALAEAEPRSLEGPGERAAFWINLYNACVSLSLVELGIRENILLRADFFIRTVIELGGFGFSLDAIENGVLRGNRRPRAWPLRPFGSGDPRRALCLAGPDRRLCFALNKGAASSPAVRIFSAAALDEELEAAERDFAARHFTADAAARRLSCSRIFAWARQDIGAFWLGGPAYRGWKTRYEDFDWRAAPGGDDARGHSAAAPGRRRAPEGAAAGRRSGAPEEGP